MQIRPEQPGDETAIQTLTAKAFAPMAFADGTEQDVIHDLRRDGDLTISLVALNNGQLVGHVAFSPVTIDGRHDGWFGLGPVSVAPTLQRTGIGTTLINTGLSMLK